MPRRRNDKPCVDEGVDGKPCSGPAVESRRCGRHARTWRRKARRCDAPDCSTIISDPNARLGEGFIRGRTLPSPWGSVTYCRRCEPLLLRRTEQDEAENIKRLFSQLVPDDGGQGWIWTGRTNSASYGLLVPAGGTARHQFLAHRVMHGLLSPLGGHRRTEVLDHRDGNRANVAIFNLEAVSVPENRRRRDRPPLGPSLRMWSYRAALLSHVYNLPVPMGFPTLLDFFGSPEPPTITSASSPMVIVPLTKNR